MSRNPQMVREIVERIPKKACRVAIPADCRRLPIQVVTPKIGCDETVPTKTFVHIMFSQNLPAEVRNHREAPLMSKRVVADMMGVGGDHTEGDLLVAEKLLTCLQNPGFVPLNVAVKKVQRSQAVLVHDLGDGRFRYGLQPGAFGLK